MSAALDLVRPTEPSEADRQDAREAGRALARLSGHGRVRVEAAATVDDEAPQTFILPAAAVRLLTDMLAHLAEGQMVAVIPKDAALTTNQAADLLNVSRPFLIGLLEAEVIPFYRTGTHRRIRFGDLMAYRERRAAERDRALAELAAEGQDLGIGY